MMRLDKYLSERLGIPRGESRKLAAKGRVTVNGVLTKKADTQIEEATAEVAVDGRLLAGAYQKYVYLMLNKPEGVVSAAQDKRDTTVVDLVKDAFPRRQLFPAGRLDKTSTGFVLLTDDGAFANLLTHPSGGVGKLYRVTVRPRATEEQVVKMSSGVVLDDGVKTQPAVIHVVVDEPGRTVLEITLHEGRNRQIRRMCEAVGLEVIRLKRSAEGPVKLGMLQPGEYRELKKSEISALRNAALKAAPARKAAPAAARRPGPIKHD